MKNFAYLAISGALFLTGCSNDDTTAIKKDIESLKQQKDKSEKEYKSLQEDNKSIDKEIKEKQSEIDTLKKEKEAEIKVQIKREEAAKKKQEAIDRRNRLIAKQKAEQEAKVRAQKEKKTAQARNKATMPNTIAASTNGKIQTIKSIRNVGLDFNDAGMKISINRIQIFKVTDMPKDQVVLFDGETEGYVLMYEVTAENTLDKPLYYNNIGVLDLGDKKIFSENASFIPPELQESSMKKSKNNYSEYAPKEKTISYKSIAINKEDYKQVETGKAHLFIKGGVSQAKDMKDKTDKQSKGYLIQQ
ncbi:DUF5068 domain-containing protein [Macrococcoides bohemicum]|uniref:DUF5068 domain-containing protein n=1 Tax=Macrococcoides bohemicum TaxID=1903056 RepID=UPI0028A9E046|nr:DUF5068 domain-containing protein [Macrococcus bohemicus]